MVGLFPCLTSCFYWSKIELITHTLKVCDMLLKGFTSVWLSNLESTIDPFEACKWRLKHSYMLSTGVPQWIMILV